VALLLATLTGATAAFACGPRYPNSYLLSGDEARALNMPVASFRHELSRILGVDLNANWGSSEPGKKSEPWSSTLNTDVEDLRAALRSLEVESDRIAALLVGYRALRAANPPQPQHNFQNQEDLQPSGAETSSDSRTLEAGGSLDKPNALSDLYKAVLLESIPKEFAHYCRGAIAYHKGEKEVALREWKLLLDLPEEERRFKSTWAAHMIAKASLQTDPASSVSFYAKVRELADAGFHDSLGLAEVSLGWQAQAEMYAGEHAAAIQHYLHLFQRSEDSEKYVWYGSLKSACWMACKSEQFDPRVTEDSLCRQVLAAWMISSPYHETRLSNDLYRAIRESGAERPFPDADRLAWAAYSCGDMENAKQWLELAEPESPYSLWVQSKILLREGDIGAAVGLLHGLTDSFPPEEAWSRGGSDWPLITTNDVKADLGVLLLGRGEYAKALDLFLRSDYWLDAAYIAERVLTTAELRDFVDSHVGDSAYLLPLEDSIWNSQKKSRMEMLRGVLARRFMRAGELELARSYMAEYERETLSNLAKDLRSATKSESICLEGASSNKTGKGSRKSPDRETALHYLAAAECIHRNGMEFLGTEIEPDWTYLKGMLEIGGPTYHRTYKPNMSPLIMYMGNVGPSKPDKPLNSSTAKVLSASDNEMQRVWKSAPIPNKRFHYRYVAANLMWKAADALPDNDPLIPYALYWGGTWIKDRDPKAADRFYKAMVRRCPHLPYSQEADRLRWFPATPPPEPARE
jgi:tetratricopeptide (TPR) repeat protein